MFKMFFGGIFTLTAQYDGEEADRKCLRKGIYSDFVLTSDQSLSASCGHSLLSILINTGTNDVYYTQKRKNFI